MAGKTSTFTSTATASPVVEDLLRLAWSADLEGRPGLRDALMTLLVAESGAEDAVLAERCRRSLVARQPDHWYATSPTLGQALAHERVAGALTKLRSIFPPVRVQRLLLRAEAQRGAFTGGRPPLDQVLQDLRLMPTRKRPPAVAEAPAAVLDSPREEFRALPFPGKVETNDATPSRDPDRSVAALYLSVLFAMAVLLHGVVEQEPASRDSKAA